MASLGRVARQLALAVDPCLQRLVGRPREARRDLDPFPCGRALGNPDRHARAVEHALPQSQDFQGDAVGRSQRNGGERVAFLEMQRLAGERSREGTGRVHDDERALQRQFRTPLDLDGRR
jgi:hypothetical protein